MPAAPTQCLNTRRTDWAVRPAAVDRADVLFGVVKAFNQRDGRHYPAGNTETLFDAVKLYQARRA
ncbi:MAG: hypothetical protein VKP62_02020 [Candidatus Sericytochromatia bacterium]|nr:hypothetical protein [Candidatus Sericytochromatia bacterium]